MIKVGLSGNRYSGKNRISKIFTQIGVPVFRADLVLKFILIHNHQLRSEIIQKVGGAYFKHGELNVDKVKADAKFSQILDIVEPELLSAWQRFQQKNKKSIYCIYHSSILFERKLNKDMDLNISVFSPHVDRVERCKFLTNKSISSIYSLSQSEMGDLDKNKMSDYVIHNYNVDSKFYGDCLTQVNIVDRKIVDKFLEEVRQTRNLLKAH